MCTNQSKVLYLNISRTVQFGVIGFPSILPISFKITSPALGAPVPVEQPEEFK